MPKMDTETKQYMSRPAIFADVFNYLIYKGRQVIKPEALSSVDTTELAVPYGNNARVPVQKHRDNMKQWLTSMQDGKAVYVLLGCENQSEIHYAMPVRDMLYDGLNYASQVEMARDSYKKSGNTLTVDENGVTIRITSAEFLSGFHKSDKLIPVITAVVYFGADEWDAPMSIHEMLQVPDEELLAFIPDYKINLIAPARLNAEDFSTKQHEGKFHTGFGTLMQVIKYQNEIAVADIMIDAPHVDDSTADMIEEVANIKFERVYDEKGEVDMCKGMEAYSLKMKIEGAIDMLREVGVPEEEIAERVAKKFDVTIEYVKDLMMPKAV